jgi:AcrR family transcriptional regulator
VQYFIFAREGPTVKEKRVTQRQLQSRETKNKIFETALKLFAHYGYENVTIDDIVQHSGMSKGSFYTHFRAKEHIFIEQFRKIDDYYEDWEQTHKASDCPSAQLLSFVKGLTQFVVEDLHLDILKVVYTSQISLTSAVPKSLSDKTRPYFLIISRIISQGQQKGEFRTDLTVEDIAELITRSIRGLLYDWCLYEGAFDLEQEGQRYFTLILDMLRNKG